MARRQDAPALCNGSEALFTEGDGEAKQRRGHSGNAPLPPSYLQSAVEAVVADNRGRLTGLPVPKT